jgi:tRNA(Ile)-lysidine synthetase-like protein
MIARAVGEARRALCAGDGGGAGWLRGERVLIACSGGPDSLALLGVMELLAPSLEVTLAVGHVDHGLRVSSALEAAQVEALAARRGLPFAGARLELAVGAGLPARARRARRAALEALAAGCGAGWIALGHTATDQAETVLMHMVRGAGLEGLAGMAAIEGRWLRPLLRITRAEAAALCGRLGLGLAAIDDPTNHDERHLRVELREAVLPRLRARNPRLERAISALTGQARDAEDALAGWAAREEAGRRGWLPMIFIVVLMVMFMRQMQAGGGRAMSFGKSKARLLNEHQNKVTFKDVAGVDEAREDVEEIIDFLRDTGSTAGRRPHPEGRAADGPAGHRQDAAREGDRRRGGRAVLQHLGSDFVEMFVGVGASRVRDLFEQGKKNAPCIIFIDEIDAVGRHRGAGLGGGHDEREQTLNQLLVEMDGFEATTG